MTKVNENHAYAARFLSYAVEEPFNGDTDYNVVAMFDCFSDAEKYAAYRNEHEPDREFDYRVVSVGTATRDESGMLIR